MEGGGEILKNRLIQTFKALNTKIFKYLLSLLFSWTLKYYRVIYSVLWLLDGERLYEDVVRINLYRMREWYPLSFLFQNGGSFKYLKNDCLEKVIIFEN